MTSCHFFLPGLYPIKIVVVVSSLLAYNIVFFFFFKLFSTYFLRHVFQNISLKHDSSLENTSTLSVKYKFLTTDLFAGLEQVLHNHCPTVARV